MKTSPWLRWLTAVMASFALLLLAACGDDDDDGNGDDTSDQSGDEDRSDASTGDEEEYVADLCAAFLEFQDSIVTIATDPENADATDEEGLELTREPFETLLQAMEDADPPGDIEEFHDGVVDTFRETLDRIEDGDTSVFDEAPGAIPAPPQALQQKYAAIAAENSTCQQANFGFGG